MRALGRHLILELFGCDPQAIRDLRTIKEAMTEAARIAGATIVDSRFHYSHGIVGVIIISESHLSIRTWPEHRYAAVDIFTCGKEMQPEVAVRYLAKQLGAGQISAFEIQRGLFLRTPSLQATHSLVPTRP